jgi:hypothetical protein
MNNPFFILNPQRHWQWFPTIATRRNDHIMLYSWLDMNSELIT